MAFTVQHQGTVFELLSGASVSLYVKGNTHFRDQSEVNFNGNPAAYPTLVQLETLGTVMQEAIPDNPYDTGANPNVVNLATVGEAAARTVPVLSGTGGWAYYVDNALTPPAYTFYANTNTTGENDF